jgi:predicted N-acetyltransferase YhbS
MPQIIHERPEDAVLIEPLLDECFGPQRFTKTAYKIREEISPLPELSFVVREGTSLLATIRYWPLSIGGTTAALLLGPIAVAPARQGQKIGVNLIKRSLAVAEELGHQIVILVGDPEYYGQFGFTNAADRNLEFPGPVERRRFLVKEMVPGALFGASGMIEGAVSMSQKVGRVASDHETRTLVSRLTALSPPPEAKKT